MLNKRFYEILLKCNVKDSSFDEKTGVLEVKSFDCSKLYRSELKELNIIKHIRGELIFRASKVTSIDFFNYLESVEKIIIEKNKMLISISGFNALESISSLLIDGNEMMEEIYGFNSLFSKQKVLSGPLKIINNKKLKSISFLRGVRKVNSSVYLHNNSLVNLKGLEALENINASFSLSSNKLKNLKELQCLKIVDGMLGIVNNELISLEGLENLEHLKTVKWNGTPRTLAMYGNPDLENIKALSNIVEVSGDCIIIIDSSQKFEIIPDEKSCFSHNNISVYSQDNKKLLLKSDICFPSANLKSRFIDIREEFVLDEDWRPGLKYLDYTFLRAREGHGTPLKRINLVPWQDKIYIYHFLKQNKIPSMPVLIYSHRQNDDFFEKLQNMYKNGLKSFVVKMSHLANSNGIYRIKDGKFIMPNDTRKKEKIFGKEIDFNYLKEEISKKWLERQEDEDWATIMTTPGIILEELIEDSTELKFSIVFGKVAGFFIRSNGFPSFDAEGKALTSVKENLPIWWKEGRELALKVAKLVKADHIRIDLMYYKGKVIVNEITWNGGERSEFTPNIAKLLNEGYLKRLTMLGKKIVDVKNDDFIKKILFYQEFKSLSSPLIISKNIKLDKCKFIIIEIDTQEPQFFWINSKKNESYYKFYNKVIDNKIDIEQFNEISYYNNRKNIVGSLIHYEKYLNNEKKSQYGICFDSNDSIDFEYVNLVWNFIEQTFYHAKNRIFIQMMGEVQKNKFKEQSDLYKDTNLIFKDVELLYKELEY